MIMDNNEQSEEPGRLFYIQLLRSLDGLVISMFAMLVFAIYAVADESVIYRYEFIIVVPIIFFCFFSLSIPSYEKHPTWNKIRSLLKISTLVVLMTAPFIIFWINDYKSHYLTMNICIFFIASAVTLFCFAILLVKLGRLLSITALELEARVTCYLIFWILMIVGGVFSLIGILAPNLESMHYIFIIPGLQKGADTLLEFFLFHVRFFFFIPLIFIFSLIFRYRIVISMYLKDKLKEET